MFFSMLLLKFEVSKHTTFDERLHISSPAYIRPYLPWSSPQLGGGDFSVATYCPHLD
jgi:hypothetical protein